jgi:hypothetical protein
MILSDKHRTTLMDETRDTHEIVGDDCVPQRKAVV